MAKADSTAERPPLVVMVDADGAPRDFWPSTPSRQDCVSVGFPTDFESFQLLEQVWPSLTIAEKEALGFLRKTRALQIERLILAVVEKRKTSP